MAKSSWPKIGLVLQPVVQRFMLMSPQTALWIWRQGWSRYENNQIIPPRPGQAPPTQKDTAVAGGITEGFQAGKAGEGEMKFQYHYPLDENFNYGPDTSVGHIKLNDGSIARIYLCGAKTYNRIVINEHVLPGYRLCRQCLAEHKRLLAGKPTPEQVKTWWQGGREEHEREMEMMK